MRVREIYPRRVGDKSHSKHPYLALFQAYILRPITKWFPSNLTTSSHFYAGVCTKKHEVGQTIERNEDRRKAIDWGWFFLQTPLTLIIVQKWRMWLRKVQLMLVTWGGFRMEVALNDDWRLQEVVVDMSSQDLDLKYSSLQTTPFSVSDILSPFEESYRQGYTR